ncbi:MAG: Smr/MutS family protein [Gallionella sp.]
MTSENKESDTDAALFRAAIGTVQPIPQQNRIAPQAPPRKALQASSPPAVEIADTLSDFHNTPPPDEFLSNGLSRMTLRKLRRNAWAIRDTLDLHGLHSDAARRLLQEFLHHAHEQQMRCVLVIHGKGLNSASGEAVLKIRTRHWLTQHQNVLAYCDAAPKDGGNGAVLILLRTG